MATNQHFTLQIGESHDGVCDKCGSKTMLICAGSCWSVGSEPLKAGEEADDAPESVEIDAEVTAHYCDQCGLVTSLSFNQAIR
jgi:hypothetical protein